MSEVKRQRLTRPEQRERTRAHLLDAAERLFAERGIGETSIEQISDSAGYSRGAFYSNFSDKDAIVYALLERNELLNFAEIRGLQQRSDSPDGFLADLTDRERSRSQSQSVAFIEYVLFVARNPEGRDKIRSVYSSILEGTEELIEQQFADIEGEAPISAQDAAKIMLALDEGFGFLRLIDPDRFPLGIWGETVAFLNEATQALITQRSQS